MKIIAIAKKAGRGNFKKVELPVNVAYSYEMAKLFIGCLIVCGSERLVVLDVRAAA